MTRGVKKWAKEAACRILAGMVDEAEELVEEEDEETEGLVPYAPDFTPATLGQKLGEDRVLEWLLELAKPRPSKAQYSADVAMTALSHIENVRDRRDMASHVLQGLQNYLLLDVDDDGFVRLSRAGEELLAATAKDRDELFARHILTRCNGYRLVEAIQRLELRGERVVLEQLSEELDRSATSKNISTMKAWLSRAGVMKLGKKYAVDEPRLAEVLGTGSERLLGLEPSEVEFLLAARVLRAQQGTEVMEAADIKALAETRTPDVRIPGKALGRFVQKLVSQNIFDDAGRSRSRGGTRVAVRLSAKGFVLADEQVRGLVAQAGAGMPLAKLRPLAEVIEQLSTGNAERLGRFGEMLAVHVCLMLGIRVVGWRTRLPVEVDLTAERVVGLSYQRWHVQVKNTEGDLDADRVDREIGAAAGTGATHLLFVVPRAGVTSAARAEIHTKTRLTPLHIYVLSADVLGKEVRTAVLLRDLRGQQAHRARLKQSEADRRERQP